MGSKLIPILISILLIWVTLTIFHINNQEKMVHQPHGIEKIYSLLTKMTMTTTKITTTTTQNKKITEIELFKENLDTKLIMDRTCNCEHSYFKKLANVIYKKPSSYIHNGVNIFRLIVTSKLRGTKFFSEAQWVLEWHLCFSTY